jgi:AbrB family looped-hinge helix DNA binding protein
MQNKKIKLLKILGKKGRVTIPFEIRQRVGFTYNDILSFEESEDGKSVIIKRENLCDCEKNAGDRENEKTEDEVTTLFDFLNSLSPEQQRAALVHISVKLAEKTTEKKDKR